MPDSFTAGQEYKIFRSPSTNSRGAELLIEASLKPRYLTTISKPGGLAILATVSGRIVGSVYARPECNSTRTRRIHHETAQLQWRRGSGRRLEQQINKLGRQSVRAQTRGNCLSTASQFCTHAPLENSLLGSRGASTVDLVVTAGHVTSIGVLQLVFPGRPSVYDHQPLLTVLEWRSPMNDADRRIRPSRLADQQIQEAASVIYFDSLPQLADALDLVANTADLDFWYRMLTNTLRMPFQEECGAKPRRSRPGWTHEVDVLRRSIRTLYDKGFRSHSQALRAGLYTGF
jgi:hypothetical protein